MLEFSNRSHFREFTKAAAGDGVVPIIGVRHCKPAPAMTCYQEHMTALICLIIMQQIVDCSWPWPIVTTLVHREAWV
jgi:hypothetical protein